MKKRSLRTPFDFIARSQFLHSSRQRTRRSTGNSIMLNAEGKRVHATSPGQTQATKEGRIPFYPAGRVGKERRRKLCIFRPIPQHSTSNPPHGREWMEKIDSERRQRDKLARTLERMYKSNKSYKREGIKKKKKRKGEENED